MRTVAKNLPLPVTIFIFRTIFKLPVPAQRFIFKNNTRPRINQKRWIHNVSNDKGLRAAWIGEGVKNSDDAKVEEEARSADVILLFVHGGAGRFGHSKMYMDSFIRWIEDMHSEQGLKMRILTVKYGLAPDSQYPSQIQSVGAAYRYLVEDVRIDPLKVMFAGDSMGGHLCLSTLYHNQFFPETLNYAASLPIPGGVILISPFLIHGVANVGSYRKNKKHDYVPLTLGLHIIEEYVPHDCGIPLQDPRISPYFASNFKTWLPQHVLVIVGSKEVMADDIMAFTKKITEEGEIDVTIVEEPMTHDWFCVTEVVRDGDALKNAERTMGNVIKRTVKAAGAPKSPVDSVVAIVDEKIVSKEDEKVEDVEAPREAEEKLNEKVVVETLGEKGAIVVEAARVEVIEAH